MSEAVSVERLLAIQTDFQVTLSRQTERSLVHEQGRDFGMAYIAKWAVLEAFAKALGPVCQRVRLAAELQQWMAYLHAGSSAKPPPVIGAGKFDLANVKTNTIPAESLLKQVLPDSAAPNLYQLLAAKGKYRNRRNTIAHSGEAVGAEVYVDFQVRAETAFTEIEIWLRSAIDAEQTRTGAAIASNKRVKR